ncbi:MAG TPA: TIGR00645 family protein [Polyangiaceae bacterium]|nr:TIGR00645 family protein [Polyangiaceae bacterium]
MPGRNTTDKKTLGNLIFLSRWLQAPLYLGLIIAQVVYVYRFILELWHLIAFAVLNHPPPASVPPSVSDPETVVMLTVLGLIDVVMIANLLIMVIVGGYETFVSRLNLQGHPDQPEWLSHVNAGILKVKLAMALIGISSIHLLKTFINAGNLHDKMMMWQVVIHVAFLLSALSLAWIDRLTFQPPKGMSQLPPVPH